MSRGFVLLLVLLGLILLPVVGAVWFFSDPLKGLWLIADLHGGLSKWEDRTVKVVDIKRNCNSPQQGTTKDVIYDAQYICDSSSSLNHEFVKLMKSRTAGQLCFDDGANSKTCPAVPAEPVIGKASVTVTGINKSDGDFTAQFDVSSSEPAFYLLATGDLLVVDVCRNNPRIARLKAGWSAVKGC